MNANSIKDIFEHYPDALKNRGKLLSLLRDFFPEERLDVNVFVIAFDSGIVDAIDKNDLDDRFFLRVVKKMTDEYGLNDDRANWAARFWIDTYGVGVLSKKNKIQMHNDQTKGGKGRKQVVIESVLVPIYSDIDQMIDRSCAENGHKYPKNMLSRDAELENKYGIVGMTYTILEEMDWLCVKGEITVSKIPFYSMLCLSAFDEYDRLIRYSLDVRLDPASRKKVYPFKFYLDLPKNKKIAKLKMYPMRDPCWVD